MPWLCSNPKVHPCRQGGALGPAAQDLLGASLPTSTAGSVANPGSSRKGIGKSEPQPYCEACCLFPPREETPCAGVGRDIPSPSSAGSLGLLLGPAGRNPSSPCGSAVLAQHGHGARRAAPKAFPSGALAQPMLMRKGVIQRRSVRTFYFKLALRSSPREAP